MIVKDYSPAHVAAYKQWQQVGSLALTDDQVDAIAREDPAQGAEIRQRRAEAATKAAAAVQPPAPPQSARPTTVGKEGTVSRRFLGKAFEKYSDAILTSSQPVFQSYKDKLARHEARLVALETELAALKAQPLLKNGGTWRHGSVYSPGDVALFKGTRWVCTKAHAACGAPDHSCWQLWEKDER